MWSLAFAIALGVAMAELFRMFLRSILDKIGDLAMQAGGAIGGGGGGDTGNLDQSSPNASAQL